ncbi:MAG: hypothetical protein COB51_04100 [Moraxellaceae bacterium]|nr:MAG: hypothetical protein COB51_04100 [Moraxellaceae bacterium]
MSANISDSNSVTEGEGTVDVDTAVQLKKTIAVVHVREKRNFSQMFLKYVASYQQLSLREQLLLLGMMTLFAVFLYGLIRWLPMQVDLQEQTERLQRHNKQLRSLSVPSVVNESSSSLQRKLEQEEWALARLQNELEGVANRWLHLDDKAALQSLKLDISSLALRTGLEVVVNKPVDVEKLALPSDHANPHLNAASRLIHEYERPGVQYEMQGSYPSLLTFFNGLNELPNQVSLGQFDITVVDLRTESGRQTLNISLTLVL